MSSTTTLSRHYEQLTSRERVSLLAAAWGRRDDVEAQRLMKSAPCEHFRLPDHFGLIEGLHHLALMYVIQQLDLAALYWQATSVAEQPLGRHDRQATWPKRLYRTSRLLAYSAGVRAEGWRRFCANLFVKPDDLLGGVPGYETVRRFEEMAQYAAFSEAQARAYLAVNTNDGASDTADLETADSVAAAMQECLDQACSHWE